MKKTTAFILLIFVVLINIKATPALINYQGRLLQANGQPVNNGYVNVSVKLYDAESGGTQIYEESVGQVTVVDSLYSFQFGTNTYTFLQLLQHNECWIQLEVNNLDMLPRKQLVSVPYAINSVAVRNTVFLTDETSIGDSADGSNDGVAVGYDTDGTYGGTAVGSEAIATSYGVAVGDTSTGNDGGTAVGYASYAPILGVAIGNTASVDAFSYGIAIGNTASVGSDDSYGIAIGANSQSTGEYSVAIGYSTVNNISNTARLRGMLYLDGGSNVYTRDTFGTGTWTPLVSGFTGVVTNHDGYATQMLYYTNGLLKAVQ